MLNIFSDFIIGVKWLFVWRPAPQIVKHIILYSPPFPLLLHAGLLFIQLQVSLHFKWVLKLYLQPTGATKALLSLSSSLPSQWQAWLLNTLMLRKPLPLNHDSCTASWFSEQTQLLDLFLPPVLSLLGYKFCLQILRKGYKSIAHTSTPSNPSPTSET